ncbi:50S ribosomal protein L13 [Mesoaciditoga lauensis]|uniref:50S ribosomal protein L13 n=1 Tax=Mesoaciditoga lauensis TaxID=1495039 RepID=UPI0005612E6D|nr:50S ribosomal protein L13 [Mesoaciditoga lauensis]
MTQKTYFAKKEEVKRKWYVVDATGKPLGRLAREIAVILRGKNKPIYTPYVDTGDFVVVVNAEKVALTGNKLDDKFYHHHTGYMGNLRSMSAKDMLKKHPEDVVRLAVRGMMPKGVLGRHMLKKLKIYRGPEHPHTAQKPEELDI